MNIFSCFRKDRDYSAKEAAAAAKAFATFSHQRAYKAVGVDQVLKKIEASAIMGFLEAYVGMLDGGTITALTDLGYRVIERNHENKHLPEYFVSWEHI
jgi:hypothetical protein